MIKNYIPVILAVLLGVAAVIAVRRVIEDRRTDREKTSTVVTAARALKAGDLIVEDALMEKEVPVSARPVQAVLWSKKQLLVNQTAQRPIAQGDYVLLNDVGMARRETSLVGEGEWAVAINVGRSAVSRLIQPGDEVAVIGTLRAVQQVKSADLSAAPRPEEREITAVLLPRVRILDVGSGEQILVALPPQQAQFIIAAQRKADLVLALRKVDDASALNRKDLGLVDDSTFNDLIQGLSPIQVPKEPGQSVTK